jgi:hypothetical protein
MPTWLQQFLLDAVGGLVGGFIGFAFAYWLANIQRRRDKEEQVASSRRNQITRAKVPLERIRDQIESSYARQAYFNRETEDRIEDQVWAASYTLADAELVRLLEEARQPLHDYAHATNNPGNIDALKPYLTKIINRLEALH